MLEEVDLGLYRFVSRVKDIIIRGSTNISPLEIEAVLESHPAVESAAVVGVEDAVLGQRVAAAIEIGTSAIPDAADAIRRFAQERLADYKVPETIMIVEKLPRNPLGKIDRAKVLADMASAT